MPDNAKPVSRWKDRDEAFTRIVEVISKIAKALIQESAQRTAEELAHQGIEVPKVEDHIHPGAEVGHMTEEQAYQVGQRAQHIKEIKKIIFKVDQVSDGFNHFVGRAINKTFNQEGEVFLDLSSVDDISGKISAFFGFRKGLSSKGNLVGTIDVDYRLELVGIISSFHTGPFDCQLSAHFTDPDTIKGICTLVPHSWRGLKNQTTEFVLMRKLDSIPI